MTEDQIERSVERAMNRLDRELGRGHITEEEYDKQVYELDIWAERQYSKIVN